MAYRDKYSDVEMFRSKRVEAKTPCGTLYVIGNYDMEKRVDLLKELLTARGINSDRVKVLLISYLEAEKFIEDLNEFIKFLKKMVIKV